MISIMYWGHKKGDMRQSQLFSKPSHEAIQIAHDWHICHKPSTYVSTQQQLRGIRLKGRSYWLLLVQYTRNDDSDDGVILMLIANYHD